MATNSPEPCVIRLYCAEQVDLSNRSAWPSLMATNLQDTVQLQVCKPSRLVENSLFSEFCANVLIRMSLSRT
jgi:hypothetical protein